MSWLAVSEAAERLGVTSRQVQYLVTQGSLRQIARGLIDEASVELLLTARGDVRGRVWTEATAWAAIALLSGSPCGWVGPSQQSRLRAQLRDCTATELVARTRNRADATRYLGHPSTAQRLRLDLIDTTPTAATLGLATTNAVDGYLAKASLAATVTRHGLVRDDEGPITLRATTMDLAVVKELVAIPVLAALDLAESLDVRARRIGLDKLDDVLRSFHA